MSSRLKELDTILEILRDGDSSSTFGVIQVEFERTLNVTYTDTWILEIISKLIVDGYVKANDTLKHRKIRTKHGDDIFELGTLYHITFNGLVHLEEGGYHGKETNRKIQANLSKTLALWVAIGTVGVLVVEILKWLVPVFWEHYQQWHENCCSN